jgi:hypothetical protein
MFIMSEQGAGMNKGYEESGLLRTAIDAVERYGVRVDVLRSVLGHDAQVKVTYKRVSAIYDVDVRANVNNTLIARRADTSSVHDLLVVPHVTAAQAELCRNLRVQYVDGSGNMQLDFGEGFVEVTGQKRKRSLPVHYERDARTAIRAFQPSGLRVVFALLCDRHIVNAPYRDIAELSSSSLGTVGWVMAELIQDGYVESEGRQRALHRFDELLDRWTEAYASTLYPKLWLGRFNSPAAEEWFARRVTLDAKSAWWGGETAAAMTGIKLRPASATVYVDDLPGRLIGEHRLRRDDREGLITFRERFWGPELITSAVVPDVLVQADMIASGDPRQIEAAAAVRDRIARGT